MKKIRSTAFIAALLLAFTSGCDEGGVKSYVANSSNTIASTPPPVAASSMRVQQSQTATIKGDFTKSDLAQMESNGIDQNVIDDLRAKGYSDEDIAKTKRVPPSQQNEGQSISQSATARHQFSAEDLAYMKANGIDPSSNPQNTRPRVSLSGPTAIVGILKNPRNITLITLKPHEHPPNSPKHPPPLSNQQPASPC